MEACIDDAPHGGPFLEDDCSYKGECGHVRTHMKVNLPPIYGLKICWRLEKLKQTCLMVVMFIIPAILEAYILTMVVGNHSCSSPHSQNNYANLI